MQQLLQGCRTVSGSNASLIWVDEEFLLNAGVAPWTEVPLWVPSREEDMAGFSAVNCGKAIAAGLTFRPLDDTIRETLVWDATRPASRDLRAGLKPEREVELLAAWKAGRS
jgi:2'-hydroxyisoflavone reductase